MKTNLSEEQAWLAVGSLMVLALVALAGSLAYTRAVMIPFVLAIFIATVVSPIVDFQIVRLKFPRGVAVSVALLVVLGILAILGLLLAGAIREVIRTADTYSSSFAALANETLAKLGKWQHYIDHRKIATELQSGLLGVATQTVGTATGLLSNGFLIVIFVVFMLAGRDPLAVRAAVYAEIEAKIRSYLASKFALSAVTGLLVWVVLALFGLKMAALFGMLAFLLNFIPSVGSVIATLLPIPVAVAQFSDPWSPWAIVGVVALPGAIQMIVGNVIEPKLIGKGLELHPVTILLALAFWGLLWGVVGMVLAVPITASIRIVLMRFATTKPLGNLLAGELPGNTLPNTSA